MRRWTRRWTEGAVAVLACALLTGLTLLVRAVPVAGATTSGTPSAPVPTATGRAVTSHTPSSGGYDLVTADGGILSYGGAGFYGPTDNLDLNRPVVGMAATPDGTGYWLVAGDGGIFSYGDASFHGSAGNLDLNQPIVGMAATPDGGGYWLVAADGGVFTYGDAAFQGSTGGLHLNQPIVGMAATPDGGGYWLVAADGGIFSYGDAAFDGSAGNLHLNSPIVGMAATPDGGGYWLVAADGGIFAYGDAAFHGSTGGLSLTAPVVGMAATPDGGGYWLVAADGGVFAYGDATFSGSVVGPPLSPGGVPFRGPIVAMDARTPLSVPPGAWTSSDLVITPTSLGAVTLGMTQEQAELAAGTTLVMYGDGYSGPASGPWATLLDLTRLEVYGLGTDAHPFSSLVASGGPGDRPTVTTPQGVSLGDTVQKLTATYGAALHYYPANPTGGFDPSPGYVADTPQGSLSFWATNGVVDQMATGPIAASGERVG